MTTIPFYLISFGLVIGIEFLLALNVIGVAEVDRTFMPWFAVELGALVAAIVIWWFSRTGKPLCRPDSWIQGHAVWQILGAAAIVFLYFNLLAETVS